MSGLTYQTDTVNVFALIYFSFSCSRSGYLWSSTRMTLAEMNWTQNFKKHLNPKHPREWGKSFRDNDDGSRQHKSQNSCWLPGWWGGIRLSFRMVDFPYPTSSSHLYADYRWNGRLFVRMLIHSLLRLLSVWITSINMWQKQWPEGKNVTNIFYVLPKIFSSWDNSQFQTSNMWKKKSRKIITKKDQKKHKFNWFPLLPWATR